MAQHPKKIDPRMKSPKLQSIYTPYAILSTELLKPGLRNNKYSFMPQPPPPKKKKKLPESLGKILKRPLEGTCLGSDGGELPHHPLRRLLPHGV